MFNIPQNQFNMIHDGQAHLWGTFLTIGKPKKAIINLAIGTQSLQDNTKGNNNIALGHLSLKQNQTGSNNISIGNNVVIGGNSYVNKNSGMNTPESNLITFIILNKTHISYNKYTEYTKIKKAQSEQLGSIDKLHPMKQITVMAVIQFLMLAVMGGVMLFIGLNV